MSRGDLEPLSVTARALRGPLFIWKPFRHLMLFGGQNFSLLFVLLFSCHSGMKASEAGANPVSGPLCGIHITACGAKGSVPNPRADVQFRVLPRGVLRTWKVPVAGRCPENRIET